MGSFLRKPVRKKSFKQSTIKITNVLTGQSKPPVVTAGTGEATGGDRDAVHDKGEELRIGDKGGREQHSVWPGQREGGSLVTLKD